MKHLTNLINVVTEITIHLYLLHRLPKHLQIIILDICIHQIILTLTEVHLRAYHHHLIHIRTMVPGMVVLPTLSSLQLIIIFNHQITFTLTEVHIPAYHHHHHHHIHILAMVPGKVVLPTLNLRTIIIIKDIMDTILVLETIVGNHVEDIIIITTIKADHHHHPCLLIFLLVLLHLWEPVITIVIVIVTVIDITDPMGVTITEDQILLVVVATGGGEIPITSAGNMFIANLSFSTHFFFYLTPESWSTSLYHINCIFLKSHVEVTSHALHS